MQASSSNLLTLDVQVRHNNSSHTVTISATDTLLQLKQRIFEVSSVPAIRQGLLFNNNVLAGDTATLSDLKLHANHTLYVTGMPRLARASLPPVPAPAPAAAASAAPAATPASGTGNAQPGTDIAKLRASTLQNFVTVTTVLRPHAEDKAATAQTAQADANASRWPRESQAYAVYTRMHTNKDGSKQELTGIGTFGLSNPFQNTFYFAIGIGIEIFVEAPTAQARLAGSNGVATGASITDSWMFAITHEIAHQCFALGLQIRQLLEKLQLLSVEIAGVNLPNEFLDPVTGRCCVLLGHLGDPEMPRGFNVTVPHQQQWILQSVLHVPARLLTFTQCLAIRKDGAEARRKLAEGFVNGKSFSISSVDPNLWLQAAPPTAPNSSAAALAALGAAQPAPAAGAKVVDAKAAADAKTAAAARPVLTAAAASTLYGGSAPASAAELAAHAAQKNISAPAPAKK